MTQAETTFGEAFFSLTLLAVAGHIVYWALSNFMCEDEGKKMTLSDALSIPKVSDGVFLFLFGIFLFYAGGVIKLTIGLAMQLAVDLPEHFSKKR